MLIRRIMTNVDGLSMSYIVVYLKAWVVYQQAYYLLRRYRVAANPFKC